MTWRSAWLLPAAAAIAMFALVWGVSSAGAQATSFGANLSGDALTTPVTTSAGGTFSATLSGDTLSYTLVSDATGITQAHIHLGAAGADGAPVVFLFGLVDPGVDGIDTSGSITEADLLSGTMQELLDAMNSGGAYVNVHTEANPGGEVRGQIVPGVSSLPSTGSGGLADTGSGSSAWVWALMAAGLTLAAGLGLRKVSAR